MVSQSGRVLFFILLSSVSSGSITAAEKTVYALYEKSSRFQEITLDGVRSQLPAVRTIVLGDEGPLKSCDNGQTAAVIAIGKASLDRASDLCKTTPIIFSLVSAPRLGNYKERHNVTGVSFDLSFRLFLEELQKVLKPGSRIGFIYSSDMNEFLTTEMDYVESEFGFTGVRRLVENRDQLGKILKDLIEVEGVKAVWVLPDPLYNSAIFKKLSELTLEKGVLLVTNFEVLVKEAGAGLALAPSYFDTGVQTAQIVEKVLSGTSPYDIAYQRPRSFGVYLSLPVFDQLKITLPNDLKFKEKVTTLLNDGQELQKEGKSGEALKKFREALKYDKSNATARYFVNSITAHDNYQAANARLKKGNRMGALPLLVAAAPFLPDARSRLHSLRQELHGSVGGIFQQGVTHFKRKNYRQCIASMNMVLMIDPGNRQAEIYKEKAGNRAKAVTAIH